LGHLQREEKEESKGAKENMKLEMKMERPVKM